MEARHILFQLVIFVTVSLLVADGYLAEYGKLKPPAPENAVPAADTVKPPPPIYMFFSRKSSARPSRSEEVSNTISAAVVIPSMAALTAADNSNASTALQIFNTLSDWMKSDVSETSPTTSQGPPSDSVLFRRFEAVLQTNSNNSEKSVATGEQRELWEAVKKRQQQLERELEVERRRRMELELELRKKT